MKLCLAPQSMRLSALAVVLCAAWTGSAAAQEKNNYQEEWHHFMGSIGFGSEQQGIDYAPRPAIAVPPSYTLPQPGTAAIQRPAGFPNDPDVEARRKALIDARRPLPPGENAGANNARSYLIEPPAEYLDPQKVAATGNDHVPAAGEPAAKPKKHHRHRDQAQAAAPTPAPAAQ